MGKMLKDCLGNRMKTYERGSQIELERKVPVISRIDGKAFHTLTRNMERPFDSRFQTVMARTAMRLVQELQGAKLAYVQSDEISILLTDYDNDWTEPWFGYNVQKMCSISAAIASVIFNVEYVNLFGEDFVAQTGAAFFDARFFSLSKDEVVNYFIWRQQDAMRNSISSHARVHFSDKELHGVSKARQLEMLQSIGQDHSELPVHQQRGYVVEKLMDITVNRAKPVLDWNPPVFTESREYVNKHVYL